MRDSDHNKESAYTPDTAIRPSRAARGWAITAAVVLLGPGLLTVGGFVLFSGALLLGWGAAQTVDVATGKYGHLEAPERVVSPDGKTRFEADVDGKLRLVDAKYGRVLQSLPISVDRYRRVEASWRDGRHVLLTCHVRYPMMANVITCVWDRQTGAVTDPYSGEPEQYL